jgi:hypothetical protein
MVGSYGVSLVLPEALKRAPGVRYDPNDSYVSSVLDFALRVGTGVGGPVQDQVGRHPWRIAFGREKPYGAAAFNPSIRGVPHVHFVVSRTINSDPEPQASRPVHCSGPLRRITLRLGQEDVDGETHTRAAVTLWVRDRPVATS